MSIFFPKANVEAIVEEESSKTRPGKNQKKPRALTNGNRKRKKVTVTVVQDRIKGSESHMA